MSATAHAVLSLFVGAAQPVSAPHAVPAPRPVDVAIDGAMSGAKPVPYRPPPARPIAVVTVGLGALAVASGASLVAIGIDSRRIATRGRTEGELHARVTGSKHLLAVGIPVASLGLGAVIGGIVWIVRDRRRARASHRQ